MGRHHARILSEMPGVELVAACDADRARADEHAALRGCQALASPEQLPHDLDAVVVATPTSTHRAVALPLLERGVSGLVEKPIAATLADADALLDAATRGGAVLVVGHTERFNPALEPVLPWLRDPVFVESHRLGVFPDRSLDVDVVLDLMIHDVDLLLWLTGAEAASVAAVGVAVLTQRVDIANARLEFTSGCTANVTASRVSAEPTRKLRVFTDHSYVSVDLVAQTSELFLLDEAAGGRRLDRRSFGPPPGVKPEPLRRELEAFVAAVRGDAAATPSGDDGRRALEVVLRVNEALEAHHRARSSVRGAGPSRVR